MKLPKIFNWSPNKKNPNQRELGNRGNMIGGFFGTGYTVDDFNLFSQVKDYRTDLLNGTNWTATEPTLNNSLQYLQFFKLLQKYSTAIFNDFVTNGFTVFARIDDRMFYVSKNNYTKSGFKISIHGFPGVEVFEFDEPNFFCGELTIYQKCEPFQRLYNIALSCQKNGMSKSGFVNVISPKTPTSSNTIASLTDDQILDMEKTISKNHGISTSEQSNMLILKREVDIKTIMYDFSKLGILETKKICEEYVCSKLGVSRMLVSGTELTYANYQESNKILYENHSKYCEFFCNFAKNELGFDVTYKTIAEDEKGIEENEQNQSLNGAQISSLLEILASVSGGLITRQAAINIIISAFPQITIEEASKILLGVNIGVSEAVNAPENKQ